MTIEIVVGLFISCMVGCLAFFLSRFINRYDEFEKKTTERENIKNLELHILGSSVKALQIQVKESGFDPTTKGHITLLSNRVNKLDANLKEKVLPLTEKVEENYGRIIALDSKLVTMFETVQLLVGRSKKKGQE